MGLDRRAIATNGYWQEPVVPSLLNQRVVSFGYTPIESLHISLGGITDSFGDDLRDSTGDVIYDSLGIPVTDFGNTGPIPTLGYWSTSAELNARIASFGYLGSFALPPVWLANIANKSWVALNSAFRMR